MSELKNRIRELLKPVQLVNLATVTSGGLPWTRYVMTAGDDELNVRCATFLTARKVSQIQQHPEVHLCCGVVDPKVESSYCQVQGRAEIVKDQAAKEAFWNPTLEPIFSGPDDPNYAVVVVRPYRIELWTPPAMEPEVLELG